MSLVRYRPVVKGKEPQMIVDESGDWTSLTCYYLLHDKFERLGADLTQMTAWGRGLETELRLAKEEIAELKNQLEFYKCKLNADSNYDALLWQKFLADLDKFQADQK